VHSLDANDAYAIHDWEIIRNTGRALLGYEPGSTELTLGLAAEMPTISEDGKVYTFTLREGVTFADGTPLTANDFVYAWERFNNLEGEVSGLVQVYVEDVKAIDDLTVQYTLKNAYGFFPALAATAPFVPVNPNIFGADALVAYPERLDGVGPYRMVSLVPGEQMVLEANPTYYREDAAKIPNVIIRYYADPTTMANAVESGEIDVAWRTVGPVEAARLEEVDGLTVMKVNAPALRYLVFNHTYPAPAE